MQSDIALLHLSLIDGIGPVTIDLLLQHFSAQTIDQIYQYKQSDFERLGIGLAKSKVLVVGLADQSTVAKELQLIGQHQVSWVSLFSEHYPNNLKNIQYPPVVLYFQGNNLFDKIKSLAFVGARKADHYARKAVDLLVPQLVQDDWVIVSGGAFGTDSFVHQSTLDHGGRTIVVLGSGMLYWYPSANNRLFKKIVEQGGMIVTNFSMQTKPLAGNFPARNRIISGLSLGTVVVQAAEKSGALITAEFCLSQGKEVFAIPGPMDHALHVGCHKLIQQGAKLVTCVEDIVDELGYTLDKKQSAVLKQPEEENSLFAYMQKPVSTEILLEKLNMSLSDLQDKLFQLSLEGKIEQDMMGLWRRI